MTTRLTKSWQEERERFANRSLADVDYVYCWADGPDTREQRCWVHVVANVLSALPKSVQPAARRALAEIRDAEDRAHAETAVQGVRRGVRSQVAQGGGQDHRQG